MSLKLAARVIFSYHILWLNPLSAALTTYVFQWWDNRHLCGSFAVRLPLVHPHRRGKRFLLCTYPSHLGLLFRPPPPHPQENGIARPMRNLLLPVKDAQWGGHTMCTWYFVVTFGKPVTMWILIRVLQAWRTRKGKTVPVLRYSSQQKVTLPHITYM